MQSWRRSDGVERRAFQRFGSGTCSETPHGLGVQACPETPHRFGAQARHIGSESRHRHSRRRGADEVEERLGDIGFGRRPPLTVRIRGISDEREAALLSERAQLRLVSRRADERRRIDLPVSGVKNRTDGRADDEAV